MKTIVTLLLFTLFLASGFSQHHESPCSHNAIMQRHLKHNPNAIEELEVQERELQEAMELMKEDRASSAYVIPVVMHVFHWGDLGMMDMEQALSGLEILNQDFNGLNDGWDTIDPEFDPIKSTVDITFCLATIDPDGNPTTGVVYHEDEQAVYNDGDLFQYAWDNYKYLNIYFPKYTGGEWSLFTAYAYYPSTFNTENDIDGIFYSSIRWGYGANSELEEGQDWASVCTHEAGHWLDLRHTFEGGCNGAGDLVDDTPPTLGGDIFLEGCNNNDFSCGVHTNGENFMDYNHDCKKMFTQGQVDRMMTALYLPSRINLWSEENLIETGCLDDFTSVETPSRELIISAHPNPAEDHINFSVNSADSEVSIYNLQGQLIESQMHQGFNYRIDLTNYSSGMYFYSIASDGIVKRGQFAVK
jgi:hypothetical protein